VQTLSAVTDLSSATSTFSSGPLSNRWFFYGLSFRLWISLPEFANVLTSGCLLLDNAASFILPPGSTCRYRILFGSAHFALFALLLAPGVPPSESLFQVLPLDGSFGIWVFSFLQKRRSLGSRLSHLALLGLRLSPLSWMRGASLITPRPAAGR